MRSMRSRAAAVAAAALLLPALPALAVPVLTVDQTTSSVSVPVTWTHSLGETQVFAHVEVGSGTVTVADPTGLEPAHGYDSFADITAMTFSGTANAVAAALGSLQWTPPTPATDPPSITVKVTKAPVADNVAWDPASGHFYEVVESTRSWDAAHLAAQDSTTVVGTPYLATVETGDEYEFLRDHLNVNVPVWLGAQGYSRTDPVVRRHVR